MPDAWSFVWLRDPRGFLKILILITDLLSLGFFVEGVGFLKIPEFRLYFIVTGGCLLILLYRIISYIFEGKLTSGPQEVLADVVGALLLTTIAVLLVFRGLHETGIWLIPSGYDVTTPTITATTPHYEFSPWEFNNTNTTLWDFNITRRPTTNQYLEEYTEIPMNWILIFISACCGFLAGIILAIDACFVMRLPAE